MPRVNWEYAVVSNMMWLPLLYKFFDICSYVAPLATAIPILPNFIVSSVLYLNYYCRSIFLSFKSVSI